MGAGVGNGCVAGRDFCSSSRAARYCSAVSEMLDRQRQQSASCSQIRMVIGAEQSGHAQSSELPLSQISPSSHWIRCAEVWLMSVSSTEAWSGVGGSSNPVEDCEEASGNDGPGVVRSNCGTRSWGGRD